MTAVRRVLNFSLALGRKAKRTRFFFILGLVPVLLSLLLRLRQVLEVTPGRFSGMFFYSNVILPFYVQFLLLMLALFFGTSIILEEVEGRTLSYLLTRPLPRPAITLGKYAASALLILLLMNVGLAASFIILNIGQAGDPSLLLSLLRDVAVLDLSLLCYLSLFTFLGALLKRAVLFGLLFCFGWENVLVYFPGATQKLAIAHYVKSLIPLPAGQSFSFLRLQLEPSPPLVAVLVLAGLTLLFLAAAALVFSWKEYLYED